MSKPVCVWDITIPAHITTAEILKDKFKAHCKRWTFSHEKGSTTGYEHYQCRISLKTKARLNGVKSLFDLTQAHFSITSSCNHDNDFYVVKEDTRIDGPWSDKDPYIPRQIRDITMWTWQQQIIDDANIWNTRTINVIYDRKGNSGKSTLGTYLTIHKLGRSLPPLNDFRDLMRIVMNTDKVKLYIFDIPKAMPKKYLGPLYAGIEKIKDGYAFDDRYSFKEEYFDCPNVWVFTNEEPDETLMTQDRWKVWSIIGKRLVRTTKPYCLAAQG